MVSTVLQVVKLTPKDVGFANAQVQNDFLHFYYFFGIFSGYLGHFIFMMKYFVKSCKILCLIISFWVELLFFLRHIKIWWLFRMAMTENINLRNSKFSRCHASFYNKWCVLCMENCSMKEFPFHMQACSGTK